MARFSLAALLFATLGASAPTGSSSTATPTTNSLLGYNPANGVVNVDTDNIQYSLAPGQTDAATIGAPLDFSNIENPQPIRGSKGGLEPGPQTPEYARLNPDRLAPPGTDHGAVKNAQWPLGLSHAKLGLGRAGWSRQQNVDNIPEATEMAGVDMRLEEGGYRELHWHKAAEWSYVLNGSVRVQAMNDNGETFVDDLSAGDIWYFPPGIPHSLQGLEGGVEFLLVFDDGSFSEDNTFLASETFARNPKEILSKNFNLPKSAWDNIPPGELFIFPGTKAPKDIAQQNIVGPGGIVPIEKSYTYHASKQEPNFSLDGGSVKIVDPTNFPIAAKFSTAIVTVKPGALREIHWHTTSDEWNFFISGSARIGIYAAANAAQTFDFNAGDCGYIPKAMTHYVENTGKDDVVFIEVLQADHFSGKMNLPFFKGQPVAWTDSTSNCHGYIESDKLDGFSL
ncbi:putative Oxalate decarboxylase oxdC [Glarea lozoyensis 74030]|uniref:Putative Oxalate decarboxylase oxdC n=1 Tax=Glarea lozoyensis (strain ATCC 74030 / MF5533) TaxID=1104152 RepID=H0EWI8_GLAL7|nr:putative Oxalate decarboxylase oxdC [Glarea lozoyensis 74030]